MASDSLMILGKDDSQAISVNLKPKGEVKFITSGSPTITTKEAVEVARFILRHAYPWTAEAWCGDPALS